jgi:hypothetical protein
MSEAAAVHPLLVAGIVSCLLCSYTAFWLLPKRSSFNFLTLFALLRIHASRLASKAR